MFLKIFKFIWALILSFTNAPIHLILSIITNTIIDYQGYFSHIEYPHQLNISPYWKKTNKTTYFKTYFHYIWGFPCKNTLDGIVDGFLIKKNK